MTSKVIWEVVQQGRSVRPLRIPISVAEVTNAAISLDEAMITIELTLLKTTLMLLAIPGETAPAATVTKAPNNAYSIKSWPWRSFQIR